jgi:antitoxin HicB
MAAARVTKKAMAERLHTSRAQVDRLLDPANVGVSLESVTKAAHALGKRISVQIVDVRPSRNRRRTRKSAA